MTTARHAALLGLCLSIYTLAPAAALGAEAHSSCDHQALIGILRADDVAAWRSFMQHCPGQQKDARGFSVYDRARLLGSHKIIDALLKQGKYNQQSYTLVMGKLIQSGLRFLTFDAGVIDGKLGARSKEAIKRYQKKYGFTVDGQLHDDWLADFYRRVVKQAQQNLTDLGFDSGGADGIIGPKTRTAMQAFRQERQMPSADYREVDDQILYQLMMLEHERHKKALAKRDAERQARRVAQEAARRKEVAKAREEAKRRAQAERQAAEAAAAAAKRARQAEEARMRELQAMARQAEQENARIEAATTQQNMQQTAIDYERVMQEQRQAEARAVQARLERERQAAERAAAERKAREEQARKAAAAAQAAEEKAQREAQAAAAAAAQARKEAQNAFHAVKRNKPVHLSKDMQRATAVAGHSTSVGGFNEIKGTLQFSSARVCSVSGQPIESSWCEAYYPSGNGKQCTVIMSSSGTVISFLCD